jgi:hypothetical protein
MLFYGVTSPQTEMVVEFFLEREAAEAMIGEVRQDVSFAESTSPREPKRPSMQGLF